MARTYQLPQGWTEADIQSMNPKVVGYEPGQDLTPIYDPNGGGWQGNLPNQEGKWLSKTGKATLENGIVTLPADAEISAWPVDTESMGGVTPWSFAKGLLSQGPVQAALLAITAGQSGWLGAPEVAGATGIAEGGAAEGIASTAGQGALFEAAPAAQGAASTAATAAGTPTNASQFLNAGDQINELAANYTPPEWSQGVKVAEGASDVPSGAAGTIGRAPVDAMGLDTPGYVMGSPYIVPASAAVGGAAGAGANAPTVTENFYNSPDAFANPGEAAPYAGSGNLWSDLWQGIKANQTLAASGVVTIGGLLKGIGDRANALELERMKESAARDLQAGRIDKLREGGFTGSLPISVNRGVVLRRMTGEPVYGPRGLITSRLQ